MKLNLTRALEYRQYAVLVLRVVLGLFFLLHGLSKFGTFDEGGFADATGFFADLDMPAPHITAPVIAIIETLFGLGLIFGVITRVSAIVLAALVTTEIIILRLPHSINPFAGEGYVLELALFVSLVAVAFFGPGALALDE